MGKSENKGLFGNSCSLEDFITIDRIQTSYSQPFFGRMKFDFNNYGHMTKMAAILICVIKSHPRIFQTKRQMILKLVVLGTRAHDDPGATFSCFTARPIFSA